MLDATVTQARAERSGRRSHLVLVSYWFRENGMTFGAEDSVEVRGSMADAESLVSMLKERGWVAIRYEAGNPENSGIATLG